MIDCTRLEGPRAGEKLLRLVVAATGDFCMAVCLEVSVVLGNGLCKIR
jgi:hypothetical protein